MDRVVLTVDVVDGAPVLVGVQYPVSPEPDWSEQAAEMADFEAKRVRPVAYATEPDAYATWDGLVPSHWLRRLEEDERARTERVDRFLGALKSEPRSYSHWGMFRG